MAGSQIGSARSARGGNGRASAAGFSIRTTRFRPRLPRGGTACAVRSAGEIAAGACCSRNSRHSAANSCTVRYAQRETGDRTAPSSALRRAVPCGWSYAGSSAGASGASSPRYAAHGYAVARAFGGVSVERSESSRRHVHRHSHRTFGDQRISGRRKGGPVGRARRRGR